MANSISISKLISALALVLCMLAASVVRVDAVNRDLGHVLELGDEPIIMLARVDMRR